MFNSNLASLLAQPPQPQGINFGYAFSEPSSSVNAGSLFGIAQPGVYAILVYDPSCRPRPYRVLYFGESQDIYSRATTSHEKYDDWRREAGPGVTLYRAFHFMSGSSQAQRQVVETNLIETYNPPCNQKLSFDFGRYLLRR